MKSATISSVGQCFTVHSFLPIKSATQNSLISKFLVRLPELDFPLFIDLIVEALSWQMIFKLTSCPCDSMNFFVHATFEILSSTPVSSDSVLELALTFYLVLLPLMQPFPGANTEPV